MNLLMLILIFLALLVSGGVFYVAWRLSSDKPTALPSNHAAGKDADDRLD